MPSYKTLGLMSGTSMDGIDVAYCIFYHIKGVWSFHLPHAQTYPYSKEWQQTLASIQKQSAWSYVEAHRAYGKLLGDTVLDFCKATTASPMLIASHGHTIFHRPPLLTSQLGCGATLAAKTRRLVVSDIRSLDVAKGGQGAPLVPIGDQLLFSKYDFCLNLGGFANVSYDCEGKRIAFDICPFNTVINDLYVKAHPASMLSYDKGGAYTATGHVNKELLEALNNIEFYKKKPPKSLAREWKEAIFMPVVDQFTHVDIKDKLRTIVEHQAIQISRVFKTVKNNGSILITGGGAYNTFFIETLKAKCPNYELIIPESKIIDFKEALIFAFIGLLRYLEQINCLKDVTGATSNSCCGAIYDGREPFF